MRCNISFRTCETSGIFWRCKHVELEQCWAINRKMQASVLIQRTGRRIVWEAPTRQGGCAVSVFIRLCVLRIELIIRRAQTEGPLRHRRRGHCLCSQLYKVGIQRTPMWFAGFLLLEETARSYIHKAVHAGTNNVLMFEIVLTFRRLKFKLINIFLSRLLN